MGRSTGRASILFECPRRAGSERTPHRTLLSSKPDRSLALRHPNPGPTLDHHPQPNRAGCTRTQTRAAPPPPSGPRAGTSTAPPLHTTSAGRRASWVSVLACVVHTPPCHARAWQGLRQGECSEAPHSLLTHVARTLLSHTCPSRSLAPAACRACADAGGHLAARPAEGEAERRQGAVRLRGPAAAGASGKFGGGFRVLDDGSGWGASGRLISCRDPPSYASLSHTHTLAHTPPLPFPCSDDDAGGRCALQPPNGRLVHVSDSRAAARAGRAPSD